MKISIIISLMGIFMLTDLSAQNYFPLKYRNSWEYHELYYMNGMLFHDAGFHISSVGRDSVMPNGLTYFDTGDFSPFKSGWLRRDNLKFYFFNPHDSADVLLLDFTLPVDDTIHFNGDSYSVIKEKFRIFIFGDTTDVVDYMISYGSADNYLVFFSDKFGPVLWKWKSLTGSVESSVTGCRINNISYGLPLNAEKTITGCLKGYYLEQNYPNPFNPSTIITYTLPVESKVILKVYDILGREVSVLVNEQNTSGRHEVRFNASGLPAGVYIYRMEAREYTETRKFILMK